MAQERRGGIVERDGKVYARVTYKDEKGKWKAMWRLAKNRTDAKNINKRLIRELDDYGSRTLDASRMTFAQLAEHYSKSYLQPAKYVDGRKVSGVRSLATRRGHVEILRTYFGKRILRDITPSDLERFKAARLNTPTKRRNKQQRSIASVNRELSVMRRMLNIAKKNKWIIDNPFSQADSIISLADERTRERIITRDEEAQLLAACEHPRRTHLKPIIICALDTGMRRGEILALRWLDVDFENEVITVAEFHTKTLRERHVSMTVRLRLELEHLYQNSPRKLEERVFGVAVNVKRSFDSARRAAGLANLRFHDLRHTAATRLVQGHAPLQEVGRILGHTQASTTYRYVNANVETAKRAAAILNAYNAELPTEANTAELLN
jgi:integrase